MELWEKECRACRGDEPRLKGAALQALAAELGPPWQVVDGHHLAREFRFPDFRSALEFTNRIGALAEEAGHHPDLELGWGRLGVKLFTHKIDGLSESDFVLAARIGRL